MVMVNQTVIADIRAMREQLKRKIRDQTEQMRRQTAELERPPDDATSSTLRLRIADINRALEECGERHRPEDRARDRAEDDGAAG